MPPTDFKMPPGGLNIRPPDDRLDQELRLHNYKRFAAVAFAQANRPQPDRLPTAGRTPRIGIVSAGKSYLDVRQALDELGIDEAEAAKIGVRLLKIGMVWPLDPVIMHEFARGPRAHHLRRGEALPARDACASELLFNDRRRRRS